MNIKWEEKFKRNNNLQLSIYEDEEKKKYPYLNRLELEKLPEITQVRGDRL